MMNYTDEYKYTYIRSLLMFSTTVLLLPAYNVKEKEDSTIDNSHSVSK